MRQGGHRQDPGICVEEGREIGKTEGVAGAPDQAAAGFFGDQRPGAWEPEKDITRQTHELQSAQEDAQQEQQ